MWVKNLWTHMDLGVDIHVYMFAETETHSCEEVSLICEHPWLYSEHME